MKSEGLDFSSQIATQGLLASRPYKEVKERLQDALLFLCERHAPHCDTISPERLLRVYARGYLNNRGDHLVQGSRSQQAAARVLLFIRMERGKTVPYLYKKLDQDLGATAPPVFDDGERVPLLFTKEQLIEASLLARKFGIEHDEEELLIHLQEYDEETRVHRHGS